MFLVKGLVVFFSLINVLFAETAEQPKRSSDQERIYELEARLNRLEGDLESQKTLVSQEKPNDFNPSISVIGDLGGQYGFNLNKAFHSHEGHDHSEDHGDDHEHGFNNGVFVKEIEFEFRGQVDPIADALVAIAIHPHDWSEVHIHLEEAWIQLLEWPGLGSALFGTTIKAGKFKTALGRANRVHRHNIPQMDYPLALKAFLGPEGYAAPGLSLSSGFNLAEKTALNVFLEGVFNSRLPMQEEEAEKIPSGIAHLWLHQELARDHFLDVGGSALVGRKGKEKSGAFWLLSSDIHYSFLPTGFGQDPFFLFGTEFFAATPVHAKKWPLGFFTWAQVRLLNGTFLGALYDLAPTENGHDPMHALGGYLSYYTSEFLRFRLGYEHVMPTVSSFNGDHRLMLSMMFVLGSHPIEPYYVNR